jgi:UDP-3-O-[3-hydroxymyristoyl] glucosamine N-acyltransferase
MQITVSELSKLLNGEVIGDEQALLHTVAKIEDGKPGALSFLANPKYENHLYNTKSTAVLVNRTFVPAQQIETTLIKVDDAYAAFSYLLEQFAASGKSPAGIDKTAVVEASASVDTSAFVGALTYVGKDAVIGAGCQIHPQVYIGSGATIGKNVTLFAGVKIYHACVIGDNTIVHSGTVIGSDGFGFAPQADKSYKKIPQTGNVVIEEDVEIGSNCVIDRATIGSTIIRKGVKLDNLIQVAHNVEIGEHTVIASQSGIAGSSKIGKHCVIAGQVGFAGHITIADGSSFGAQSGIANSIDKPNKAWFGSPAMDLKRAMRSNVIVRNLPELENRVRELEKLLKQLNKEESK